MSCTRALCPLAILLTLTTGLASAGTVTLNSVSAWPNERTSGNVPTAAIDGDTSTFTWITESFTTSDPVNIAVDFDSGPVNRIRLYKEIDNGCCGYVPRTLQIYYTVDTGALSSRGWSLVTGLTNGFLGTETMKNSSGDAVANSATATITGDYHYSPTQGWASLSFDTVNATGIRIAVSKDGLSYNHYHLNELEVMSDDNVPEPSSVLLVVSATGAALMLRRRRAA